MSKSAGKNWTAEQLEAISARGCNLLVSAAAGAGKTAVLVERILSRILDGDNPVDIDRLLVVTYTNAAAAEMRERIAGEISSRLSGKSGGGRLALQLALLNRAKITTIHSFCMDVLKKYFYRLGLDPGFRIADETETLMLKSDVLDDLFEMCYAGGGIPGFTDLVEFYGGERDDSGLQELVSRMYEFSRSNPDPDLWLEKIARRYESASCSEKELEAFAAEVLGEISAMLEGAIEEMEAALDICLKPGGPAGYSVGIKEEIAMLRDLLENCGAGWDQAHRAFQQCSFATLKKAGADVDEGLKEQVAGMRDGVKKRIKGAREDYLSRTLADHAGDMKKLAPVVKSLTELVWRFAGNYRAAKAARGIVDFSDLEHYCLQILTEKNAEGITGPSAAARELQEQFEEVLVDEYQDINPVQEAIVTMVSRSVEDLPNLFMVGDVKQSIYRFRLAEPGLFLGKYLSYPARAGGRCRRINLSKNFRSRREVIDAVNFVFGRIMSRRTGEMDYDSDARLICGSQVYDSSGPGGGPGCRVELHIIDRSGMPGENVEDHGGPVGDSGEKGPEMEMPDDFREKEELEPAQAEARAIARRIKELISRGFKIYDSGTKLLRPVTYRDVVVLMRSVRHTANVFIDEFSSHGIPACADTGTGFFQSAEIETMVSLLKVVDNPRQDIPLAAVLRSPVCGLGAEELAAVRMAGGDGELWDSVSVAARQPEGELSRRLSLFVDSLERWRRLARRAAMTDLIWTIYRETGYYHYVGAMPGGALRQANLRALHDRAGQYESTTFRGLFSFLRFIDRLREKGEDQGRARSLGENEDVVRIMSIHRSKGLEFPVVAVAGLGKKFNMQDLNRDVLLHREIGLGPVMVETAARIAYPTLARMAVREKLRRETLAEEMRILYVAMTRAREKLILAGTVANLGRASRLWSRGAGGSVSAYRILSAGSHLDWICTALSGIGDGPAFRGAGVSAGFTITATGEGHLWEIHTGKTNGISSPEPECNIQAAKIMEAVRRGEVVETAGDYASFVHGRLSWVYPAREAAGKPVKISVTGLGENTGGIHRQQLEEEDSAGLDGEALAGKFSYLRPGYARPAFLTAGKELTASERGTAVHTAMRHLDLGGRLDAGGVEEQLARMLERELLTPDQASVVDCGKIAGFFSSPLGKRVLKAAAVKRELPFSLTVPAKEIYPGIKGIHSGERVIIQGVIDCLADEGDGCILIDYKTDRLKEGAEKTPEKYTAQMRWYARAVEAITGRPVKEMYIYFFEQGKVQKLEAGIL
ncbi:MAG: UvrD-helicase domain-containing protein [Bacillota bacterium]